MVRGQLGELVTEQLRRRGIPHGERLRVVGSDMASVRD
jgi:hypothetical protein